MSTLGETQLRIFLNVIKNNTDILAKFCPSSYRGDGLLFRATEPFDSPIPILSVEQWKPYLLGEIEVHDIDCRHDDMDRPEPIAEIGRILERKLRVLIQISLSRDGSEQ